MWQISKPNYSNQGFNVSNIGFQICGYDVPDGVESGTLPNGKVLGLSIKAYLKTSGLSSTIRYYRYNPPYITQTKVNTWTKGALFKLPDGDIRGSWTTDCPMFPGIRVNHRWGTSVIRVKQCKTTTSGLISGSSVMIAYLDPDYEQRWVYGTYTTSCNISGVTLQRSTSGNYYIFTITITGTLNYFIGTPGLYNYGQIQETSSSYGYVETEESLSNFISGSYNNFNYAITSNGKDVVQVFNTAKRSTAINNDLGIYAYNTGNTSRFSASYAIMKVQEDTSGFVGQSVTKTTDTLVASTESMTSITQSTYNNLPHPTETQLFG